MSGNDILERLENVAVPDVILERYRQNLRTALINEYHQSESKRFTIKLPESPVWRTVFITSAAWVLIVAAVVFGFVVPDFQSNSVEAMAIETVMASPEIQSILTGDEVRNISVTDTGDNRLEILVESHGGRIIIVTVDMIDNKVRISEISYIVMMGSIYEPEVLITGDELEVTVKAGKTHPSFRNLIDKGAIVEKAVSIECLIITRNLERNETTEMREIWAMVTLGYGDESCNFLIDRDSNRVVDRGCRISRK